MNTNSAVAVSSGTAALYMSLRVLGVGKDDEIIIPSYSCTALLNSIYMAQAKPKLIDVSLIDFNINTNLVKSSISKKTKAIIIPHTYGVPYDISGLKKYTDLPIIEDRATSIGSKIKGHPTGTSGDISVFSFYASKMITTGYGGMLVSRNKKLINSLKDYRDFDCPKTYYPRFNFQLSDINAAIGITQLNKLPGLLERRNNISKMYKDICVSKGWGYQKPISGDMTQNWYRFVVILDKKYVSKLKLYLFKNNIKSIIPIENKELLNRYLRLDPRDYNVAEIISKTTLSLPIYPTLSENQLDKIKNTLNGF